MVHNHTYKVFGIDLGTTNSCIAYIDESMRPMVIRNAQGDLTTPSVVLFEGDNRFVGKKAKDVDIIHSCVVSQVKRYMGNKDWAFTYEGVDYTAGEISSYILRKVVGDAEKKLNCTIKHVVITCPRIASLKILL
jgi:molecular chaperone DnaK